MSRMNSIYTSILTMYRWTAINLLTGIRIPQNFHERKICVQQFIETDVKNIFVPISSK